MDIPATSSECEGEDEGGSREGERKGKEKRGRERLVKRESCERDVGL